MNGFETRQNAGRTLNDVSIRSKLNSGNAFKNSFQNLVVRCPAAANRCKFYRKQNYSFVYCFSQQKVFILVCCIQRRTLVEDIREQGPKEDT